MSANDIRTLTGLCPLDYEANPSFISFRFISVQAAQAAFKKIQSIGLNVIKLPIDKRYLRIQNNPQ